MKHPKLQGLLPKENPLRHKSYRRRNARAFTRQEQSDKTMRKLLQLADRKDTTLAEMLKASQDKFNPDLMHE